MELRGFRFGEWQVDVGGNSLSNGDARSVLEPRAMDVLRYLCRHPGAVIPAEEILQACWGTTELGDNPIHKAIAQLRRALGDSSTEPRYIETVRKRGYRAIAEVVEEEEQAGIWHGGSPFRGLEAFEESHAAIFFGRVQATTRLRETVIKQVENGCAMALVLGPSGSGKTSLVRAGLLPQLMAGAGPVALTCTLYMDCVDTSGGDLFAALAAVLMDAELDGKLVFDGCSAEMLGRQLRNEPASVAARFEVGNPIRIGILIDRLEAIFRASDTTDADRIAFVRFLDLLAARQVLILIACRNDFYPELIALPELMALKERGAHFDLEPPDGADIAQMVRLPALAAGLSFEHEESTGAALDDVICDAARASRDALPLLQYCLNELYRQRSENGRLLFDVFQRLGGIEGALGIRAEQIIIALPSAQQQALPRVLSLLVNVGEKPNAVTARRASWSLLEDPATRELVTALVEARLFVTELAGEVPSFGVAHESLFRQWPRVVEWIERHQQALQARTRVATQADRWAAANRPRDLLLPEGSQVRQAKTLLELGLFSLAAHEREYIGRSINRARLSERIRLLAAISIGCLAVLATVLGMLARGAQHDAENQRTQAEELMSFMLGNFVDKLRPLGRLELLDDVGKRALDYLSTPGRDTGTPEAIVQRAKTLQLIAEVDIERGNPAGARTALFTAKATLEKLLKNSPDSKELLKALGANAFWLGQLHVDKDEWAPAMEYLQQYRSLSERLRAVDPADVDSWMELSYAHSSIGSVAFGQGDYTAATKHFEKSIELKRNALSVRQGNEGIIIDLSNSLSWLANAKGSRGFLLEAKSLFEQAQALIRPLHEKNKTNASWTMRLAAAVSHLAEIEQALGDRIAVVHLEEAVELLSGIVASDPTNRANQRKLYVVQAKLIDSYISSSPQKALRDLSLLQEHTAALIALEPNQAELGRLLATVKLSSAEAHQQLGNYSQARAILDVELPKLRGAANSADKSQSLHLQLSAALLQYAEVLRKEGDAIAAEAACSESRTALVPVQTTNSASVFAAIVRAAACSGTLNGATQENARLLAMGYREMRHIRYLLDHLPEGK